MRTVISVFLMFLPSVFKKIVYRKLFGFEIGRGVSIGFSYIDCDEVFLGQNSRIGSFTVIRNLKSLKLEQHARIGTFNWIFGMRDSGNSFALERERRSELILDEHSAITSRHILDCIDSIYIGSFSTIAGFKSQILTHSVDVLNNRQACAPVKIGSYCFVGTSVIIMKGIEIPSYSVIAAGSVVSMSLDESYSLYGGVPARKIKILGKEVGYFERINGSVN